MSGPGTVQLFGEDDGPPLRTHALDRADDAAENHCVRLVWDASAWGDYKHWQTADRRILQRINTLIDVVDGQDLVILQARYHY